MAGVGAFAAAAGPSGWCRVSSQANPLVSLLSSLLPVNTSTNGSSQLSTSGSSTVQRNLDPAQQSIENPLFSLVGQLLSSPGQYVAPFQTQARNEVNDTYDSDAAGLRQQFLATGGGSSGKYGLALANANNSRLSNLADTDATFAQTEAQLPLTAAGLASNLLGLNFGQTTSTAGSSDSATQSDVNKQTGTPASAGIVGGLASLLEYL